MLREVMSPQRKSRQLALSIDGSLVNGGTRVATAALGVIEGVGQVTVTENSAGNYTIYFNTPFVRAPVVAAMAFTDVTTMRLIATAVDSIQVEQVGADQTTPTADGKFHLHVLGFDAADQT